MTPFQAWLDHASANFRWSRFALTKQATALTLIVSAVSAGYLLDRAGYPSAIARLQLCAFVYMPTFSSVVRQSATLFQHIFIHLNWAHLAGNAAFLAVFASAVSRRFAVEAGGAKPWREFAVLCGFFTACGVFGGLVFVLMDRFAPSCTIGASGAIAGLFGACLRFAFRRAEDDARDPCGFDPIDARSMSAIGVVIAANAAISVLGFVFKAPALITAWEAHAGGLIFGALAFPWFARLAR